MAGKRVDHLVTELVETRCSRTFGDRRAHGCVARVRCAAPATVSEADAQLQLLADGRFFSLNLDNRTAAGNAGVTKGADQVEF
jgi:hypothetical protein